jgi:hypothetical protein
MVDHAVSLLKFPSEPSVRGDVFGMAWPLSIEGAAAEVRLPRFQIEEANGIRDHWPIAPDIPDPDKVSNWLEHGEGTVDWGSRHQHGPNDDPTDVLGSLQHAALVVEFPDGVVDADERLSITKLVDAAAERWCYRVLAWLSARSVLNIDPSYTGMRVQGETKYTTAHWLQQTADSQSGWDWVRDNRQLTAVQVPSTWPNMGWDMFASTPDDWTQAAMAAELDAEIPLPWQLLDSSFNACLDDNFRVAVLDAATALELVLTDLIRDHLSTTNPAETVDLILDRVRMLGNRLDFARDLGFSLAPELKNKVAALRNKVAHEHYRAERGETAVALRAVRDVLNAHAPFPRV